MKNITLPASIKCGLVLKYIGYGLTISVTDDRNRKYQEYE